MRRIIYCIIVCLASIAANAQIGYQMSLLNTATGEPRANVTVNATVTITNTRNEVIYTGTQQATSNDFGVLSLTVGNAETFKDVDFSKLPFFISISVDGVLIGKSQILNVPVAEAAKKLIPKITKEELCRETYRIDSPYSSSVVFSFSNNDTYECQHFYNSELTSIEQGFYEIEGNWIILYPNNIGEFYSVRFYNGQIWRADT